MTKKRIGILSDVLDAEVKIAKRRKEVFHIRDENKIASIYREYLKGDIFMLVNRIKAYGAKCEYGEGECFKDLLLYLRKKLRNDVLSSGYYGHIVELYYERIGIYNEFITFYLKQDYGKEEN